MIYYLMRLAQIHGMHDIKDNKEHQTTMFVITTEFKDDMKKEVNKIMIEHQQKLQKVRQ